MNVPAAPTPATRGAGTSWLTVMCAEKCVVAELAVDAGGATMTVGGGADVAVGGGTVAIGTETVGVGGEVGTVGTGTPEPAEETCELWEEWEL